ncbi:MAG: RNA polymerase sigma factor [Gemmatimonadota bacterium]
MHETFEEKVSQALDALFDGATLLAGDERRAEELVVSIVVHASRRWSAVGDAEAGGFLKWIVGRLVRQYLEYAEERDKGRDGDGEATRHERPGFEAVAPVERAGLGEATVDGLLPRLEALEDSSPDELGRLIRRCMRELPGEERAAMWLVDVMEFSYAEAARALKVDRRNLRERLFRARRELQARVAIGLQREMYGSEGDLLSWKD